MELSLKSLDGAELGTIDVSDEVFGLKPRADLLQRVVRWQLAKRRVGSHKVKGRSEIAKTGKKLYRQKGTGGARHGPASVPQFRGGGRAHGPVVRSHEYDLPKKVRSLGLRHALSAKAVGGGLLVLESVSVEEPKTKLAHRFLEKFGLKSALVVSADKGDPNFRLAIRNIAGVDVLPVMGVNVYDVLRHDSLVLTRDAVSLLEGRFSSRGS